MFKVIIYFIGIYAASCTGIPKEDDGELQLVSVIFRHGARTTYSFYPNDPHKGESFYPFGYGGLTNQGKLGEYKLGQYLKNLYGDFLGEDYTEDKLWVRSTDVTRTKMSAQLALAGLFPPSEVLTWNNNLMWQPIPVSYKTDAEEDLFHPTGNCPYKQKVINDLPKDDTVQNIYIKPFEDLYNYVQNYSGKSMKVPSDMQDLFFNLKCEADMNYTLPEWTKSVYPEEIAHSASYVYSYHNYNPDIRKINSGYLLKKILDDSRSKMDGNLNPSERKIFLYSGHESTVGYMLNGLNVEKPHIPPYGSAISFELRKKDDDYYIKLRYRNDTEAMEPKDLNIPGCDAICPYNTFVTLLNYMIPTESIQDACKLKDVNETS